MRPIYYPRRKKKKAKVKTPEEIEEILSHLDPMAMGILVAEASKIGSNPKNDFEDYVLKSAKAVLDKSNSLSVKWVHSINKFCLNKMKEYSADDPEHSIGEKIFVKDLKVFKTGQRHGAFGLYFFCIAKDKTGWKYYLTSPKLGSVSENDTLSVKGTVKSNGEGITFLSRIKFEKTTLL